MTNKNHNAWQFSQWSKNKTYWFAIRAVNAQGASAWTDLRSVALPCPVEGLSADYAANGDVSVKWNAAKRASVYDVNFSSDGGRSWQRMVSNHSATTYSFNRDPQTLPHSPGFLVAVQSRKGSMSGGWRNAPIVKDTPTPGSRDSSKDIPLADSSTSYTESFWSNGTTIWVSDFYTYTKLLAHKMSDGSRDSGKDINLGSLILVVAITSDGTTMWASDAVYATKLHAYSISNGQGDSSKDITLDSNTSQNTQGLWTDGTTMYVGDQTDDKIYAYIIATGLRDTSKEITLDTEHAHVSGLWSDGTTMWASDYEDGKVYAYKMSDGSRDSAKDYSSLVGGAQASPHNLWSDGTTMWIKIGDHGTLYAYHAIK